MSVRSGTVWIKFSDGVPRKIPAGKSDAVLRAFPGSSVWTPPRPTLMSTISALGNKDTYATPQAMGQIASDFGHGVYDMTARNAPMLASTALTMGIPVGEMAPPIAAALRTGAAGVGAYGGSVAGDLMQGQAPDLNAAARQVPINMVFGAGGEALAAGARGPVAKGLTKSWVRPTPAMIEESPQLVSDVLSTRARYRTGGKAPKEPQAAKSASMAKTQAMVAGAPAGSGISVDDALAQVYAMRDRIVRSAPTDQRLPEIDQFINEFKTKWGTNQIPTQNAHEMKQMSQDEASWANNSNEPPTRRLMHKMVAQDVRRAVGAQLPGNTLIRTPGQSRDIGYNAQDEMTQRYHDATEATKRAGTLNPPSFGWAAHSVPTAIAGSGGYAMHGPTGGAEAAGATYLAMKLLENPYVANRLALMFSSPAGQAGLRMAPRVFQSTLPNGRQ